MLVSRRELKRWVHLGDDVSDETLAERLTMAGLEVEDVRKIGAGQDDIVVGQIRSIEPHPDADKLVVCKVDVATGTDLNIVCGAKNMGEGDRVPVALIGAQPVAMPFTIVERKVRGVVSQGMLCSEEELGLADSSEGLWILDAALPLGAPVFDATGLRDTILEIGLTPNRPDCLSHMGVAREVAALFGLDLTLDELGVESPMAEGSNAVEEVASLRVDDAQGCPRYVAAVCENVQVGPSPPWLQQRVVAMGMRSINNLVDVTNVVLADVGQPLHVFDLDLVDEASIIVRRARPGESMEAIDHKTYALNESDLVIADASKPVAIAGVMGGSATEVTETTTRVLLECAYFDPTTVRKTSKRLGIHSESSHRFERGIDPAVTLRNADFAMALIARTQQDNPAFSVRRGVLEHNTADVARVTIELPQTLVPRILGVDVPAADIERFLRVLGCDVSVTDTGWRVAAPTWRPDLERPIDLVEEVARLYGYDNFEPTLPALAMGADHAKRAEPKHGPTIVTRTDLRRIERIRRRLLDAGLHEALSYSFMAPEDADAIGLSASDPRRTDAIAVANPLTADQGLMRTTLVPSLIAGLRTNVLQRNINVGLFEIARTYSKSGERWALGLLLSGEQTRHFAGSTNWDIFDVKGLVEAIGGAATSNAVWASPTDAALEPYLHPGVQARWLLADNAIATVGQLHPAVIEDLEIDSPVFIAEVDFDAVLACDLSTPKFQAFGRYPAVTRDFALVVAQDRPYGLVEKAVRNLAADDEDFGTILENVHLFDVYEGEQIPTGMRSLALQLVYRAPDRTLTDTEVAAADARLLETLERAVGATLR